MLNPDLQIMECTLRDGSYAIDFQFTARDTAIIAAALENAGFNYIEVGHGVGMNASNAGKGLAAATDEEYCRATASTLKRAKWGMFFIPGIGRHEDLEMAATYGMNFVRIGTNATEVEQSEEYVQHAKKLGMYVSSNLMKSYVLPPKELAEQAKLAEKFGTDLVSLVDSAGCMMPDDVSNYLEAMHEALGIPTGFHCHNNLAMGMANALTAVSSGVQFIDSTLQGMGRGGGNPATEILITVLKKQGVDLKVNPNQLMDLSTRIIKPLLQEKGLDPINVTLGYAGFHSSHLKTIAKYSELYDVDPRDLIIAVCEVDKVNAPEELVESMAQRLRQESGASELHAVSLPPLAFSTSDLGDRSEESLAAAARSVAQKVKTIAKKRGMQSVFNIVAAPSMIGRATVSRFVQEEFDYVVGSIEVDNPEQLKEVVETVDGLVDILFVDSEIKPYLEMPLTSMVSSVAKKSQVLGYKDNDVWARSVYRQMGTMQHDIEGRSVTIYGTDNLALKLALYLIEQGARVTMTGGETEELQLCARAISRISLNQTAPRVEADPVAASEGADVLVSFARGEAVINLPMIEALAPESIVFDAGIGAVASEAIAFGNENGIRIVRPDMRAALSAEISLALGTQRIVNNLMGHGEVAGVPVVAGGLMGRYGELVLDSVSNPSRVVGVADGQGGVIYESQPEFIENIEKVEREILRKQVIVK
ncbi:MAG: 4-hydroxy-2-oxovalerate aldolase [Pyrinomonadaceae bacterium]|nr:4-hydroxy-2-oxovalerate aldolase [Pyrinomonadaceae bacterium]